MVHAYWQIGRLIAVRHTLPEKGIRDAVRHKSGGATFRQELSWTHYRHLLGVEDLDGRDWYMNEAAEQRGRFLYRFGFLQLPAQVLRLGRSQSGSTNASGYRPDGQLRSHVRRQCPAERRQSNDRPDTVLKEKRSDCQILRTQ